MESLGNGEEKTYSDTKKQEDDDEEELDRELEKVEATFGTPTLSMEIKEAAASKTQKGESRLTFQFPGWGIDICKGAAVTRHRDNTIISTTSTSCSSPSTSWKKCFGAADKPGNGTAVYGIPNEVWIYVFRRLNARDLCRVRQTCRWLYNLASNDDAWIYINCWNEHEDEERGGLPRWIRIKSNNLNSQMQQRFSYFSKGYDYLRSALNSWWNVGGPDCHYSAKSLHSLIRKMTARDWPVVYEAFAVVFSERADILAGYLLTEFGSGATQNVDAFFSNKDDSLQCYWSYTEDWSASKRKSLSSTLVKAHISSDGGSLTMAESKDGLMGKEMWQLVQKLWEQYKRWLRLVFTHCQDLNYEVMVEKARSTTWSSTPTVYDKGIICFRNQILLRYKIHNALQCGLHWLIGQDALGFASEKDVFLLNAVLHILQEVDVADDFTLPPKTYTRAKLKRCFLLNGVTSKVL